jgi:hypothetical protein
MQGEYYAMNEAVQRAISHPLWIAETEFYEMGIL